MIDIDGTPIGDGHRPYIIAEVGINARDDLELAKRHVELAANCGADAVKFQTHLADSEMHEEEMRRIDADEVYDTVIGCEWTRDEQAALQEHAETHDVTFLSTPFSVEAVDLLESLDVPAIKVGSGEVSNYHLLERAARTGKPLLVSTGMHTLTEVECSFAFLEDVAEDVGLFYCVSNYPTEVSDFDFGTLGILRDLCDGPVGLSDHARGVEAAKAAIGYGADMVEKHFTIDRRLPGPDQAVSIEPEELRDLCEFASLYHETGTVREGLFAEERDIRRWARHSIVAATDIPAGVEFTADNLTTKRPGTGVPASQYFEILGQRAARDIEAGELLTEGDVEP